MPIKKLRQINEETGNFKRLNRILSDNWKDRSAQMFREGCTDKIEHEWDSIYKEVDQLMIQLRQMKERIEALNHQSKNY